MLRGKGHGPSLSFDTEQQRKGLLDRTGLARRILEAEERAIEGGRPAREERLDHADVLGEPVDPGPNLTELDPVRVMFVDLPARTQAEDHSTITDLVHGGGPGGKHRRVAVGGASHQRAEPNARGRLGQGGHRGGGLEHGNCCRLPDRLVVHEVVSHISRVPASCLGLEHQSSSLGIGAFGVGPEGESHGPNLPASPPPAPRSIVPAYGYIASPGRRSCL